MSVVSLELFKKHVRADDFSDDDTYLSHLLETAQQYVETKTRRSIPELEQMGKGKFPVMLQHAIMLIAGHWYNIRESDSTSQMYPVPDALQALIKPYVKLVDDESRTDEI